MLNMDKKDSIAIEEELTNWMLDFYNRVTVLRMRFSDINNQDIRGLKYEYSNLKHELREKKKEVNKIKDKGMIKDIGKFNRCKSNILEAAAYGFMEQSNSNNLFKLELSLSEANSKLSKFMNEFIINN